MSTPPSTQAPSRLLPRDVLAVGSIGLRTRKLRAALSALGVAIGIASMVAVLGISASSQAELLDTIDALGTNLLIAYRAPARTACPDVRALVAASANPQNPEEVEASRPSDALEARAPPKARQLAAARPGAVALLSAASASRT